MNWIGIAYDCKTKTPGRNTAMAKITMQPSGRFGQMFADAVKEKGISLRDLAVKTDHTYEQMRKLWLGQTSPSDSLLKEICKVLGADLKSMQEAATADRMERRFGKHAYNVLGKDPRIADIEDLLPQLTDAEWTMFTGQIRGYVNQKRRTYK